MLLVHAPWPLVVASQWHGNYLGRSELSQVNFNQCTCGWRTPGQPVCERTTGSDANELVAHDLDLSIYFVACTMAQRWTKASRCSVSLPSKRVW